MGVRVRVLPRQSVRGVFVLCVALGLAHGLVGALCVGLLQNWLFGFAGPVARYGMLPVELSIGVIFILPSFLVGLLVCRVHPGLGRVFAAGALYGAACFLGITASVMAQFPEGMLVRWEPAPRGFLGWLFDFTVNSAILVALSAAACCAMFGLAAAFERVVGKRTIEQTGFVCWACGYDLGAESIALCPECGSRFDSPAAPVSWSAWLLGSLVRSRRAILILVLVGMAAPLAFQIWVHTIPSVRFLRACSPGGRMHISGMLGNYVWRSDRSGQNRWTVQPLQYGWFIPDAGSDTTGVAVQYLPRAQDGEPAMFISRACLMDFKLPVGAAATGPVLKYKYLEPGTVRVRARLSREQARSVIAAGAIPPGLINALKREAERLGWAEADAMVTPAATNKSIDAGPFFPGMYPVDPGSQEW